MSTSAWKSYKLDELGLVGRGRSRHRPRNDPSLYGGKYPFFQTGDIKAAEFYLREYSQTYNEIGLAQSKLWNPGTLCITIAANIAETAILDIQGCFPDSVIGFIPDDNLCDVRFIKYYIDTIKLHMQNVSQGTTQDNLSMSKLLTFDFTLPPLPLQRKIASILSAYDDLIENNTRRIQLLEQMAQAIYREWFVHFRFPGHEDVPMVESELGPVPEGWKMIELGEISKISKEKFIDSKHMDLPLLDLSRIPKNTFAIPEYGKPNDLSTSRIIFEENDVLFGSIRPYLHKVVIAPEKGVTNTSVIVIRSLSDLTFPQISILLGMDETINYANQYSTGTKMPVIKWELLKKMTLPSSPPHILEKFNSVIYPSINLIKYLVRKNFTLKKSRNLLLPRLISGELNIGNIERGR